MTIVYDLWFVRQYEHREDTELRIGTYATVEDAKAAIHRLRGKPGFVDYPEGFQIQEVTLGRTGWTEGFVTEYYPRKDAERDASDLPPPAQETAVDSSSDPKDDIT
jgi:hypothetical protein